MPGAGIIRNAGIIQGRVIYEEICTVYLYSKLKLLDPTDIILCWAAATTFHPTYFARIPLMNVVDSRVGIIVISVGDRVLQNPLICQVETSCSNRFGESLFNVYE